MLEMTYTMHVIKRGTTYTRMYTWSPYGNSCLDHLTRAVRARDLVEFRVRDELSPRTEQAVLDLATVVVEGHSLAMLARRLIDYMIPVDHEDFHSDPTLVATRMHYKVTHYYLLVE